MAKSRMESEVAGLIGAERHERTGERTAYRNGSRTRTWDTRMGTIELAIPKSGWARTSRRCCSPGAAPSTRCWPSCRRPTCTATRKVDDLVKALGVDGISKSEVSRICAELDTSVEDKAFWTAFLRSLFGRREHLQRRRRPGGAARRSDVRAVGNVRGEQSLVRNGMPTIADRDLVFDGAEV